MEAANIEEYKRASRNFAKVSYIVFVLSVLSLLCIVLINQNNNVRISQTTAVITLSKELTYVESRYYSWSYDKEFFYNQVITNIILSCIPIEYYQPKMGSRYDKNNRIWKQSDALHYFVTRIDTLNNNNGFSQEEKSKIASKLVDSIFSGLPFADVLKSFSRAYVNVRSRFDNNWVATALFIIRNGEEGIGSKRGNLNTIYLNEDNPESSIEKVLFDLLEDGRKSPAQLELSIKSAKDYVFKLKRDLKLETSELELPFGKFKIKLDMVLLVCSITFFFLFYILFIYQKRQNELSTLSNATSFFDFPFFYSLKDPFRGLSDLFIGKRVNVYMNQLCNSFPWIIFLTLPVLVIVLCLFTKSVEVWNFESDFYRWIDYLRISALYFVLFFIVLLTSTEYRLCKINKWVKFIYLPLSLLVLMIYKLLNENYLFIDTSRLSNQPERTIIHFSSYNHLFFICTFYLLMYCCILHSLKKESNIGLLLIIFSVALFTLLRRSL